MNTALSSRSISHRFGGAALPKDVAGASYKPCYFEDTLTDDHPISWFEVHAENYLMDGGPVRDQLEKLRDRFPISCHGVGLSIGSSDPLDQIHLSRIKALVDWLEPTVFSEHLAWSSHGGYFLNDLLPLPYNRSTLLRVIQHIDQVQEKLQRPILLENPSTYLQFGDQDMTEPQFLLEVVRRTGCELLLDINNAHINAVNHNSCAREFINALPLDAVGEIHLAGFFTDKDKQGAPLLIDSHNKPVSSEVWALFEDVIKCTGPISTLIEWDDDLPAFKELADEVVKANDRLATHGQTNKYHVAI
jgi:uncharacterized protein (UPF0276 family)